MNTTESVIAQFDAWTDHPGFNAVMIDIASLREVREKVAALVEAASRMNRSFYFLTDTRGEVHKCVNVESLEVFNTALKGIGNG